VISYVLPAFFLILFAAFLAMAAAAFFVRRAALRDAAEVFDKRQEESPGSLKGLDQENFSAAYLRAHGARAQIFLALALGGALAASPIALGVLRYAWRVGWVASERPAFYAEGVLIWQFYMFFGLIMVWAAIAAFAARLYHQKAGGSLDEEIIRQAADVKHGKV